MKILNIAAGKLSPIFDETDGSDEYLFLVNLDPMYYSPTSPGLVEQYFDTHGETKDQKFYVDEPANTFMERTRLFFDRVCIYRYLEHVSFTEVEYFIYLLSTITKAGAEIDVIVPNYEILANLLLQEKVYSKEFRADNIVLTTELLNEPSCPHASIWTPDRAEYFFQLEKRFTVESIIPNFEFDGRSIYMRFKARRL